MSNNNVQPSQQTSLNDSLHCKDLVSLLSNILDLPLKETAARAIFIVDFRVTFFLTNWRIKKSEILYITKYW